MVLLILVQCLAYHNCSIHLCSMKKMNGYYSFSWPSDYFLIFSLKENFISSWPMNHLDLDQGPIFSSISHGQGAIILIQSSFFQNAQEGKIYRRLQKVIRACLDQANYVNKIKWTSLKRLYRKNVFKFSSLWVWEFTCTGAWMNWEYLWMHKWVAISFPFL